MLDADGDGIEDGIKPPAWQQRGEGRRPPLLQGVCDARRLRRIRVDAAGVAVRCLPPNRGDTA